MEKTILKNYQIVPVPKPRMTRSDKWKKRKCVLRYFEFCDKCRDLNISIDNGDHIIFVLPMPNSWSINKKKAYYNKPHQQRPDIDNLQKSLQDAIFEEDSHIYDVRITKVWGYVGKIIIKNGAYKYEQ